MSTHVLAMLFMALETASPAQPVPAKGPSCAERAGGAVVTLDVADQTIALWSADPAFISRAYELLQSGAATSVHFGKLIDGRDCDRRWTFHVDAHEMRWDVLVPEVCDGRPSDIEQDKKYWIGRVGYWCPWRARVVAVD